MGCDWRGILLFELAAEQLDAMIRHRPFVIVSPSRSSSTSRGALHSLARCQKESVLSTSDRHSTTAGRSPTCPNDSQALAERQGNNVKVAVRSRKRGIGDRHFMGERA